MMLTTRPQLSCGCRIPSAATTKMPSGSNAADPWPDGHRYALREQVNLLFGWKPENVTTWLFSNPNGPDDRVEQAEDLLALLQTTDEPLQAAAYVLNAIYSRQVSQNPTLQPSATLGGD
jgi:hypothetical protein